MSRGWLTPWAIRDTALGRWIWKSDDPLIPQWEFPDASGTVLLNTTQQLLPSEALVIDAAGESITPTLSASLIKTAIVSGDGDLADDLALIVASATWVGKLLVVCKAPAVGTITIKRGANIIMATDVTLDSEYDRAMFECVAEDTWIKHYNVSNA